MRSHIAVVRTAVDAVAGPMLRGEEAPGIDRPEQGAA
jgi:hypothetical protein